MMGKGDFRACIRCLSEIKSVDGRWDYEEGVFRACKSTVTRTFWLEKWQEQDIVLAYTYNRHTDTRAFTPLV